MTRPRRASPAARALGRRVRAHIFARLAGTCRAIANQAGSSRANRLGTDGVCLGAVHVTRGPAADAVGVQTRKVGSKSRSADTSITAECDEHFRPSRRDIGWQLVPIRVIDENGRGVIGTVVDAHEIVARLRGKRREAERCRSGRARQAERQVCVIEILAVATGFQRQGRAAHGVVRVKRLLAVSVAAHIARPRAVAVRLAWAATLGLR